MMTSIFLSFLGISISIGFLVALLLLLTPFFNKRYAAKWKYWIWIALALRLIVPIGGNGGQSAQDILAGKAQESAPESEKVYAEGQTGEEAGRRIIVELPAQMTAPLAVQPEKINHSISMLDIIAFIWMLGALLFIAVHLFSCFHYKRQILKKGKIVKDRDILGLLFKLKRELHIKSTVSVVEYSGAVSPLLIGFFHPVLVLPKEQHSKGEAYSPEELFFILKHELVHLKRGDICFKLLFMTANAFHWFNPLIWLMQKEAAVDMELSCDERVMQGSDFAGRKAYTETLLSTLHKQNAKRTVLSTEFYGGKQIMKKRFQNILRKNRKKNGAVILIVVVLLALSLGTFMGCSVGRQETEENPGQAENGGQPEEAAASVSGRNETDNGTDGNQIEDGLSEEEIPADDVSGGEVLAENTRILTIMKEGEPEEKPASLVVENQNAKQYSFYLPDGEWQKAEADMWQAVANEDVYLSAACFEEAYSVDIEQMLANDGYVEENGELAKLEEGIVYKARLYKNDGDVWCVFYGYPVEAEEGWGRELPVIADTFAIIEQADIMHGYVTAFDGASVTIDVQIWATVESEYWKPEYNEDAGFEVVDAEGEDITYPLHEACNFFILENHYDSTIELDRDAFADYLTKMDYPVLWICELKDGQIRSITEQYLP